MIKVVVQRCVLLPARPVAPCLLPHSTPQVALFPSPDNCRPVTELAAGGSAEGAPMRLDGCFIGACTTTQEDLILAALVLEAALAQARSMIGGEVETML